VNQIEIACICPGKPHESDTVTLKDPLDFRTATVIRKSIEWMKSNDPSATVPELLAMLTEAYLLHCIEAWSVVDEKGKPVLPTKEAITELLLPTEAAMAVADAADELYTERVILPLVARASTSSASSSIDGSISATNGTGTTPPKPSKPSSISTTQTAGTAQMTA
jgi:hypothetical protein